MCSSSEWINGLSSPTNESYHPNRAGHASGYTPTVSPYLTGSTVVATAAVLTTAKGSSTRLADQQRTYAAVDARSSPRPCSPPTSRRREARAAAARAGVDLSSRASIDAVDRLYAAREAAAFARR